MTMTARKHKQAKPTRAIFAILDEDMPADLRELPDRLRRLRDNLKADLTPKKLK